MSPSCLYEWCQTPYIIIFIIIVKLYKRRLHTDVQLSCTTRLATYACMGGIAVMLVSDS